MRRDILTTYKEIQSIKAMAWPSNQEQAPIIEVMEYTKKHGRREGLLYNNRIFTGYIRPSRQRIDEYEITRNWILTNYPKTPKP